MADTVPPEKRSRMMSGIKGKNTRPEIIIRTALHREGFRYRLHDSRLPGNPDLVFPRYHAVLFIHGCFWHGHNCHLFKWPSTRAEFWRKKINGNIERDRKTSLELLESGWRVGVIWECTVKGKERLPLSSIIQATGEWLASGQPRFEVRGCSS